MAQARIRFGWLRFFQSTTALTTLTAVSLAWAGPQGGIIEGGQATISQPDPQTTIIQQQSDRAIGGFQSFNVGQNEQVLIQQPGSHAIFWAKDYQNAASRIDGRIQANGQFWLSNANGVLVGPTAQIDTAGTLLTSSFMRNEDFLAGRNEFAIPGEPDAAIINEGAVSVADAGLVAFVAPGVRNEGYIHARFGQVRLASGNTFTLDPRGDGVFRFAVDDEILGQVIDQRTGLPLSALVSNDGTINAAGGTVTLSAVAARQVIDAVIDNSGTINAPTIDGQKGKIVFSAALPSQQRAAQAAAAQAEAASQNAQPQEATTPQPSAQQRPRQKVRVKGRLNVSANAANETGGEIQILGEVLGLTNTVIDASGDGGGGLVFVGGEYLGGNATPTELDRYGIRLADQPLSNATEVVLENVTINADALTDGRGGQVILFAEEANLGTGIVTARGGSSSGNGGFVEHSGLEFLATELAVDVSAPNGFGGDFLLDPGSLAIVANAAALDLSVPFDAAGPTDIAANSIETVLDAGGNVTIRTDDGRIDVLTSIQKSAGTESTLRFEATEGFKLHTGNKIERVVTGDLAVDTEALNVIILGNTDLDGIGTTDIDGEIITLGGNVDVRGRRIDIGRGAIQTLNSRDGSDGGVFIGSRVQDNDLRAIIGLDFQAVNAGNGTVTVEATSLSSFNDDTITLNNESINTLGRVVLTADRIEARPGGPNIRTGQTTSVEINGTQVQPVSIDRTLNYTPFQPPVGPVDDPPTAGSGTLLNSTINTADNFNYTLPTDAFADDGGVAGLALTAAGLPNGIIFVDNGNGTGTFTGTPTQSGTFTVTVTASDGTTGNATVSRTFRIVVEAAPVNPNPPPVANQPPTATTAGIVTQLQAGVDFTFTTPPGTFADDGGVQNLILSVANLPAGLNQPTLNADGSVTFTGRPTNDGTFRPTLTVTDAQGATVDKAVRFEVQVGPVNPPQPPSVSNPPTIATPTAEITVRATVVGRKDFEVTTPVLFADDGGTENLRIDATPVSGLGFAQIIRNADGSVTFRDAVNVLEILQTQQEVFDLTASDADGQSVTVRVNLIIEPPAPPNPPNPPVVSNPPTATGGVVTLTVDSRGIAADIFTGTTPPIFTDDGGVGNLVFSSRRADGTIFRTEIDLNADGSVTFSDRITTTQTVDFILTVRDADGQQVSQNVRLIVLVDPVQPPNPPQPIDNPPTASNLEPVPHVASVFGDVSLAVSPNFFDDDGGRQNLTLSIRDGFSVPDGTRVSLSPDGTLVVAGTLRSTGTFQVPVEATDAAGQSVSRVFTIVFNPNTNTPVETQVGQSNNVTPTPTTPQSTSGQNIDPLLGRDPAPTGTGSDDRVANVDPESQATSDGNTVATDAAIAGVQAGLPDERQPSRAEAAVVAAWDNLKSSGRRWMSGWRTAGAGIYSAVNEGGTGRELGIGFGDAVLSVPQALLGTVGAAAGGFLDSEIQTLKGFGGKAFRSLTPEQQREILLAATKIEDHFEQNPEQANVLEGLAYLGGGSVFKKSVRVFDENNGAKYASIDERTLIIRDGDPGNFTRPVNPEKNLASNDRTMHILFGEKIIKKNGVVEQGGGHLWPGRPGKTPFPRTWDGTKIMVTVSDIATDPNLVWKPQSGTTKLLTDNGAPARFMVLERDGSIPVRDGVPIVVIVAPAGEGIITAFPKSP